MAAPQILHTDLTASFAGPLDLPLTYQQGKVYHVLPHTLPGEKLHQALLFDFALPATIPSIWRPAIKMTEAIGRIERAVAFAAMTKPGHAAVANRDLTHFAYASGPSLFGSAGYRSLVGAGTRFALAESGPETIGLTTDLEGRKRLRRDRGAFVDHEGLKGRLRALGDAVLPADEPLGAQYAHILFQAGGDFDEEIMAGAISHLSAAALALASAPFSQKREVVLDREVLRDVVDHDQEDGLDIAEWLERNIHSFCVPPFEEPNCGVAWAICADVGIDFIDWIVRTSPDDEDLQAAQTVYRQVVDFGAHHLPAEIVGQASHLSIAADSEQPVDAVRAWLSQRRPIIRRDMGDGAVGSLYAIEDSFALVVDDAEQIDVVGWIADPGERPAHLN